MKRRSFLSTVIGGAAAAVCPWKVGADEVPAEPTGGFFTVHGGSKGVWLYWYQRGNAEDMAYMTELAATNTRHCNILLVAKPGPNMGIEYIPPKGKVEIAYPTTRRLDVMTRDEFEEQWSRDSGMPLAELRERIIGRTQ